jgi:hypothetical protein
VPFADGRAASVGTRGRVGQRNAPAILNAVYNKTQFWDGRVNTLKRQAALPITNRFEMDRPVSAMLIQAATDTNYQTQFMQVFGRGVNEQDPLRAIATYKGRWFRSTLRSTISLLETEASLKAAHDRVPTLAAERRGPVSGRALASYFEGAGSEPFGPRASSAPGRS